MRHKVNALTLRDVIGTQGLARSAEERQEKMNWDNTVRDTTQLL